MNKTNGKLSAEQIDKELKSKHIEKWKGGEVFKTIVHKVNGKYAVFTHEGLTSSPTPMLLPKNSTMELVKTWLDDNGFEVVLTNYVIKTVILKVI
jgi:hypothetical protein